MIDLLPYILVAGGLAVSLGGLLVNQVMIEKRLKLNIYQICTEFDKIINTRIQRGEFERWSRVILSHTGIITELEQKILKKKPISTKSISAAKPRKLRNGERHVAR